MTKNVAMVLDHANEVINPLAQETEITLSIGGYEATN